MALKSIQKYKSRYMTPENYPWVADMIRDVEDEIAERYMELPVDADGVPIKPRDNVDTGMGDKGPVGHLEYWYPNSWVAVIEYKPGQFTRYDPLAIRHIKPRTIEDVLASYRFDAQNIYEDPRLDGNQRVDELEALDCKVAEEIREMMA